MRGINMSAFLARAVGSEQFISANAEDTLRCSRKNPANEQWSILLERSREE